MTELSITRREIYTIPTDFLPPIPYHLSTGCETKRQVLLDQNTLTYPRNFPVLELATFIISCLLCQ